MIMVVLSDLKVDESMVCRGECMGGDQKSTLHSSLVYGPQLV